MRTRVSAPTRVLEDMQHRVRQVEAPRPQQIRISSKDVAVVAADSSDVVESRRQQRVRNKCEGLKVAYIHPAVPPTSPARR